MASGLRGVGAEVEPLEVTSTRAELGHVALACWGVAWVVFWLIAFQIAASTHDRWTRCLPLSTKAHENDRYYNGRTLVGTFHAIFVSILTVPTAFFLMGQHDVQYMYTDYLEWCAVDTGLIATEQWHAYWIGPSVALAGTAFTTFMTADVAFSLVHGFMTPDYMVHHSAFIAAGLIIRTHCMLPYNAAILLTMEASTPFLNYLLFVRHRGDGFKMSSSISGVLFFFFFIVFRIVLNTYGAVYLILHRDDWFRQVPSWQGWFLIVAIALGSGIQFFWLPQIVKMFCKGIRGLVGANEVVVESEASDSEAASSDSQSMAEVNERRVPLKNAVVAE